MSRLPWGSPVSTEVARGIGDASHGTASYNRMGTPSMTESFSAGGRINFGALRNPH